MNKSNLLRMFCFIIVFAIIMLVSITSTNLFASTRTETKYSHISTDVSKEETEAFADITSEIKLPEVKEQSLFDFGDPLPVEYMGKVSSKQGLRGEIALSSGGTTENTFHDALDLPCPEGTPVYAVADGKLVEVWPSIGNGGAKYSGHPVYGGYIEIEHYDGFSKSCYAHLSMTSLKEGTEVHKGDLIGYSGGVAGKRGSGKSTGPHLHFSIKFDMNKFYNVM